MTAVVLTGSGMTRLTEQKTEKLCLIGAIPNDHCDRFGRAVERCVRTYRRLRERKSAPEVEAELAQIEKCIWRALRLLDHATWRAAEFRRVLEDISARLHHLSPAAQDYLDFRHLKIQADGVLAAWPDSTEPGVLSTPSASQAGTIKFWHCWICWGPLLHLWQNDKCEGNPGKIWNVLSITSWRPPILGTRVGQPQTARPDFWLFV